MRDKIAKMVYSSMAWAVANPPSLRAPLWVEGGNSLAQDAARDQASAIIAALPDMIKPLEWDYIDPSTKGAFGVAGQRYTIWAMDSCGYVVFPGTSVGERFKGGIVAAIAAANAHHAATITGAFE